MSGKRLALLYGIFLRNFVYPITLYPKNFTIYRSWFAVSKLEGRIDGYLIGSVSLALFLALHAMRTVVALIAASHLRVRKDLPEAYGPIVRKILSMGHGIHLLDETNVSLWRDVDPTKVFVPFGVVIKNGTGSPAKLLQLLTKKYRMPIISVGQEVSPDVISAFGPELTLWNGPEPSNWRGVLAVQYIRDRIADPRLRVHDIALYLQTTEEEIATIFHEWLGRSIKSHIVEQRIDFAKSLLKLGYLRVKQVGEAVGYDATQFSRVFKDRTSMTPRQWMESVRSALS